MGVYENYFNRALDRKFWLNFKKKQLPIIKLVANQSEVSALSVGWVLKILNLYCLILKYKMKK